MLQQTKHFEKRIQSRGVTQTMIDIVFRFGTAISLDKVILVQKTIKELLKKESFKTDERKMLIKILDKGGLCIVEEDGNLITAYPLHEGKSLSQKGTTSYKKRMCC